MAGPIELPIILMSIFIPNDVPIDFIGVARVTTFIDPTFIKTFPQRQLQDMLKLRFLKNVMVIDYRTLLS